MIPNTVHHAVSLTDQLLLERSRERAARARVEQVLASRAWQLEERQPPIAWNTARKRQPRLVAMPGYDLPAHVVPTMTLAQQVERLLAPTTEQKAAAAKDREQIALEKVATAYEAAATPAGRSAESRSEEGQPLMAPAASALESALEAQQTGPDWDDRERTYHAAHDIWCQLGTLADRWPRRARRSERGEWERSGMITETLDAICYGFERRWARADVDYNRARREYEDLERAQKGGEIDAVQLKQAEERAIERHEQLDFFWQLFSAARSAYELLVGAGWNTSKRLNEQHSTALGLANARLMPKIYVPVHPDATQRVIVMGGGADASDALAAALGRLVAKYPALTLYTGDRTVGIEAQVARFAVGAKCQAIQLPLDPKDERAAPFRRNERLIELARPHGIVLAGPRTHGPTDALADLARARKIPLWDLRQPVPAAAAAPAEAPPVRV
jgi:hypothetical protein